MFFAWSWPMTYESRMFLISRGVGKSDFAPLPPLSEAVSSRMMSLHSSMHSSQMNTDGPAMSLRTSCWLLPQNEQYSSFSPEELFSDICYTFSLLFRRCPVRPEPCPLFRTLPRLALP